MDRLIIILGIISLFMISCKGEFNPTDLDGKVNLTFPENVQICPDGDFVGNDKIQIRLIWDSQTDFTKYRVTLKNSEGKILYANPVGKIKDTLVTLDRSTLYYWFVSGLRGKEVIPSDEWSFYTLGEATESHVPYPAEIQVSPAGENVTISWTGKDEDEDIEHLALIYGDYELLLPKNEQVYIYKRTLEHESYLVLLSFSKERALIHLENLVGTNAKLLISNDDAVSSVNDGNFKVRPYHAMVYKLF